MKETITPSATKPDDSASSLCISFHWELEGTCTYVRMFILLPMQVILRLNTYIGCNTSTFEIHTYIGSSLLLNITHKIVGSGNTLPTAMSRYYGRQNSHTCVL